MDRLAHLACDAWIAAVGGHRPVTVERAVVLVQRRFACHLARDLAGGATVRRHSALRRHRAAPRRVALVNPLTAVRPARRRAVPVPASAASGRVRVAELCMRIKLAGKVVCARVELPPLLLDRRRGAVRVRAPGRPAGTVTAWRAIRTLGLPAAAIVQIEVGRTTGTGKGWHGSEESSSAEQSTAERFWTVAEGAHHGARLRAAVRFTDPKGGLLRGIISGICTQSSYPHTL